MDQTDGLSSGEGGRPGGWGDLQTHSGEVPTQPRRLFTARLKQISVRDLVLFI